MMAQERLYKAEFTGAICCTKGINATLADNAKYVEVIGLCVY